MLHTRMDGRHGGESHGVQQTKGACKLSFFINFSPEYQEEKRVDLSRLHVFVSEEEDSYLTDLW